MSDDARASEAEQPVRGYDAIAGLVPFGLEREKPRHYRELARALWRSRGALGYAGRVLRGGVCDGCALGPRGLADDVAEGAHICEIRLANLGAETMGLAAPADLLNIKRLRALEPAALRALGRLGHPYIYRRGDAGFSHLGWEQALALLGARPAPHPARTAALVATASLSDEAAYALGKAARLLGTGHLDVVGRAEHVAAHAGLGAALGQAVATCSLSDLIGADLVLVLGSELGRRQPMLLKYLAAAKARGTRVVMVGAALVEAQLSYWDPGDPLSAVFGASVMDDFIQVRPGGEAALLSGALKAILAEGAARRDFIAASTRGLEAVEAHLDGLSWARLEEAAGVDAVDMARLGELFGRARTAVTVYGDDPAPGWAAKVQAIVNIHLARGHLGAPKTGILPLIGHAGLPGAIDCGLAPDLLPGPLPWSAERAAALAARWGHPLQAEPGMGAGAMLEAAARGEMDLLYTVGGELLDGPSLSAAAGRIAAHVVQASHLTPAALLEPAELTLLLPSQIRHEQRGGAAVTSVERRVRLSPQIADPPAQGARRPDWMIPGLVVGALRPDLAGAVQPQDAAALRRELAEAVPRYAGIERLSRAGDWIQWGGPQLYGDGVFDALPDGRGVFAPVAVEPA